MIPGKIVPSDNLIMSPKDKSQNLKESFESGGISLENSTRGLFYQNWHAKTDGQKIYIKAENEKQWLEVLSDTKITEVDLTFDQNMRPHLTYVSNGVAKFYYHNFYANKFIIESYPDIKNPRISLDDKRRDIGSSSSDIIFAYIKKETNELCYRVQRERYLTEHNTNIFVKENDILWRIGMGKNNAFLFYILNDPDQSDDDLDN